VEPSELWTFLPLGYLLTIGIETPLLLWLLSRPHPVSRRLLAGMWLTAVTYPIVVLVLPVLIPAPDDRWLYLLVAETFAPTAECVLFGVAFHAGRDVDRRSRLRDYAAIVTANVASFTLGALLIDLFYGVP